MEYQALFVVILENFLDYQKKFFYHRKIISNFVYAIKSANFAWNSKILNDFINTYCEESSLKFRDIGIPLRIALTGSTSSPSIVHIMEILGEHQTLDRLNINVD